MRVTVLNPEGTSDLSKWKKKIGFWDVFISKTSDVKHCLSVLTSWLSIVSFIMRFDTCYIPYKKNDRGVTLISQMMLILNVYIIFCIKIMKLEDVWRLVVHVPHELPRFRPCFTPNFYKQKIYCKICNRLVTKYTRWVSSSQRKMIVSS